jgi:hypothetical protein
VAAALGETLGDTAPTWLPPAPRGNLRAPDPGGLGRPGRPSNGPSPFSIFLFFVN